MPQLGAVAIAEIISAVVGAASLGVTGYELASKPGPNPRLTSQQVAQQKQQQALIAREGAPNVTGATSGGVSPNYIANAVGNQTQDPNQSGLRDAIAALFGGGGGGTSGGSSFGSGSNPLSSGSGTIFPSLDINKPGAGSPGVGQFVNPNIFEGAP
jgi:hypothetical protein